MDNRQKRIRRTIRDVVIELIGVVILSVLLWNIQSAAAVRQQKNNSLTKIDIAQQRIIANAAEADDNLETYDAFCQAKVDAIGYCLNRNPESTDLSAMARQWGLTKCYLLDASGKVVQANVPAAQQDLPALSDGLTSLNAVSLGNERYYFSALSNGGVLIGSRDVMEENALLTELRSPAYALKTLRVGTTGYVFSVNETDGTITYHPDSSLIGLNAKDAGYDPATYANGYDGWVTLDGQRLYCMSRSVKGNLLAAVVPENELNAGITRTVGLSVLIFAVVITLLVVYALILRRDQDGHPTKASDYRKLGRLYLNRVVASKLRGIALTGLIVVFFASFFLQTLGALSRQSLVSETKLASVEALLESNDRRIAELTEEYNVEYAQRAKNIAWTFAQDPTLVDDAVLAELADKAQIKAIYVFNKNGRVVATNTNFKDFALSSNETDQSYPFWQVTKGYVDEYVQAAQLDDTLLHNYFQYVGVRRLDDVGMVQLGMSPRRIANRLHTTELSYVLQNIAVENNGILLSINSEDNTFLSCSVKKYIGRDATLYGMTTGMMKDGYTGIQTFDGTQYFVSSMAWKNTIISTAVPLSTIYAQRLPMALWATLISFATILLMSCCLILSGKPSEYTVQDQAEKEHPARVFLSFQNNGKERVVQSAESRWSGTHLPWSERSPEQKIIYITGWIVSLSAVLLVCYFWIFGKTFEKGSIISYILSQKWERSVNLFSLTYAALTALEILVVSTILRRLLSYTLSRFGARCETIGRLLNSFIKYAAILGIIFYSMNVVGVDSTALITSAGILSLVVGLGAQSLISDIIAGVFIVFEGEFRVGDIVTIGDWRGTVMEIGIRTTKIESAGKDIKIFNNSAISGVVNMTKQFSYAYVDVGIEYGESLEHVEAVLKKELPVMKEHLPAIVNGPFYKGVAALADSSVNIRIVAQCQETDRIQLTRDMNREIKLIFDRHSINIPFPQIVLNQPAAHEQATRKDIKASEQFVAEQKELTKDIPVQEEN